jgi:hypothetical protein
MPTKRIFGFTICMLALWEGAKALPKMEFYRIARENVGLKRDAAVAMAKVL